MKWLKHNLNSKSANLEDVLWIIKVPDNLIYIKSNARPLKLGPCLHGTGQIWNRAEISPFRPCVYTKTTKTDEFGIS
jgi:hypothetical protein